MEKLAGQMKVIDDLQDSVTYLGYKVDEVLDGNKTIKKEMADMKVLKTLLCRFFKNVDARAE